MKISETMITYNKLSPILRKIPSLEKFSDRELQLLLDSVEHELINYAAKEIIIHPNVINNNIYIVLKGGVGLFINNNKSDMSVGILHAGGIIGEIDLNNKETQEYGGTIRSLDDSTLIFKIDRKLLKEYLNTYYSNESSEIINTLKKTDLFNKVKYQELATIEDQVAVIDVYEGNIILKEGSQGDFLYIIMSGEIDVFTKNKKNNICILAHLKTGDYFGEHAILNKNEGKRSTSVMATATSRLIRIPAILFRKIVRRDEDLYIKLCKKQAMQQFKNDQLRESA